jgi:hypothetical protein
MIAACRAVSADVAQADHASASAAIKVRTTLRRPSRIVTISIPRTTGWPGGPRHATPARRCRPQRSGPVLFVHEPRQEGPSRSFCAWSLSACHPTNSPDGSMNLTSSVYVRSMAAPCPDRSRKEDPGPRMCLPRSSKPVATAQSHVMPRRPLRRGRSRAVQGDQAQNLGRQRHASHLHGVLGLVEGGLL